MMLGTIARLTPPPDPVRWQCVVAELAAILGVEPEAFAVVWCDLALNPLDWLGRARLPQRFEDAVLAEMDQRKPPPEIDVFDEVERRNWDHNW